MEYNQLNELFLKQKFDVTLFPTNTKKNFGSFQEFENFIFAEADFWDGMTQNSVSRISNLFKDIKRRIEQLKPVEGQGPIVSYLNEIKEQMRQQSVFVSSETEEGQIISRLYKQNPTRGNAAYRMLIENGMAEVHQNRDNLIAALECVKFFLKKEETNIQEKDDKSLAALQARHQKIITEIKNNYENIHNEYLNELKKSKDEFDSCNLTFASKNDQNDKTFQSKLDDYNNKITELEKTYGEKLRLSKPVDYWNELENDYLRKGRLWVGGSLLIGATLTVFLVVLLYEFPLWLKGAFGSDQLKGLIIFTLIISTFTYLLHLFIKLANSAFHLSRDAEERKQLTHVYLALLNEKGIDEKERLIVLQSLFSRADTGLLKNDSGPTMPGSTSILDKAINLTSKNR